MVTTTGGQSGCVLRVITSEKGLDLHECDSSSAEGRAFGPPKPLPDITRVRHWGASGAWVQLPTALSPAGRPGWPLDPPISVSICASYSSWPSC